MLKYHSSVRLNISCHFEKMYLHFNLLSGPWCDRVQTAGMACANGKPSNMERAGLWSYPVSV